MSPAMDRQLCAGVLACDADGTVVFFNDADVDNGTIYLLGEELLSRRPRAMSVGLIIELNPCYGEF